MQISGSLTVYYTAWIVMLALVLFTSNGCSRANTTTGDVTKHSSENTAIKVEIIQDKNGFKLLRGGEHYIVRGAGMAGDDLERLLSYGGNSIRTWSTRNASKILDKAHSLGMTVSLGLDFGKERQGFDYNDKDAVAEQFERVKAEVLKYKDHPALLTWFIGNELNLLFENPAVFDAVNDVAKMIKELDPNHPVTTTLAGFDKNALKIIEQRTPALDFISFQAYGAIVNLPKAVKDYGFKRPYMVTEWGAIGHWEVKKTKWDAPIESTSSEKASNYAKSFLKAIEPYPQQIIGNYVFLWGQKQERTDTWYGMFLDTGERTEAVDVMQFIWTENWPENRTPRVSPIALNDKVASDSVYLEPSQIGKARIEVEELDTEKVRYRWLIRKESTSTKVGGDREYQPEQIPDLIEDPTKREIVFQAPQQAGAYRLFVYVYDDSGNAGHANIPFFVKQKGS